MKSSYTEIFKASALLGGTQIAVMLLRMIRSKIIAVLVGPTGTGTANLFTSTTDFVGVVAGLGIRSSGVRQIAAANSSGDLDHLAKTVTVLRWSVRATGLAGGLAVLSFSQPLGRLSFGDDLHTWGMALMSIVLIFDGVSAGRWALLQGLRRIRDLAKCKILGAAIGTLTSFVILGVWRAEGIVPLIIVGSITSTLVSWLYARKVRVQKVVMPRAEVVTYVRGFISLGFAFLASGMLGTFASYLARILVANGLGIEGVGLYAAALSLSTVFVGFVLEAMGTDFFPRLSGMADNHQEMNRLVNEQTEMGLLFAMPAVLATVALAPFFYHHALLFSEVCRCGGFAALADSRYVH